MTVAALDWQTKLGFALGATPRVRRTRSTARAVDTFGWDTVSALRIPYVNAAIAARKTSPPSFEYTNPNGLYGCRGDFGAWAIVRGGDGSNIRLSLPATTISGWYKNDTVTNFTCASATFIIEVKLQYLPQDGAAAPSGIVKDLKARTVSPGPTDPVVAFVASIWPPGGEPAGFGSYIVENAVTAWGNAHLAEFTHVFNTVNLDRTIDTGKWAFCNPTYTTYAYADGGTDHDSVLGALSMTSHRSPGANTQQLDAAAIPPGCEGGFLLSLGRFLNELVVPTLTIQWPNASAGNFTVSDHAVELIDGQSFDLPPVEHNGQSFTPSLQQFSFRVNATEIEITSYTTIDVSLGIKAWCQSTHVFTIGLGSNAKGQQTLVYSPTGSPIESHGRTLAEGIVITEIILGIIAAVVLIVLTVLTDGAALMVGCLIVGILFGVAEATPQIIGLVNTNDAPAIDLLAFNVTTPMVWNSASDFKLQTAGLNGALQLGGSLGFGSGG
jgi:hypothetical protein